MALLVAGQEVGAHKALAAVVDITYVDLLGVVWAGGSVQREWAASRDSRTVQLVSLEMLGSRVDLIAAWFGAAESPRRAFATGPLVDAAGAAAAAAACRKRLWL